MLKIIKIKKAEMGVGTLIIFIAMLLVAAVAAGVLIQTATSLQEKSLATGQQAKAQISTNARVIEVSGTDGRGGNLTDFQEIIKLSPGSDPIKLAQIIFTFNTKDKTSTLQYKGTSGILCEKNNINGYNTWNEEIITNGINNYTDIIYTLAEDLDDDGANDHIYVNATNVVFNLSTAGYIGVDLGGGNAETDAPLTLNVVETTIVANGTTYAYVAISGITTTNGTLNGATTTITPYRQGEGYFTAIYEQEGTNFVRGNMQRGDIIRLCFEAPDEILEDEEVRLNFIPKVGTPTLTQFVTQDVISTERVYLYP